METALTRLRVAFLQSVSSHITLVVYKHAEKESLITYSLSCFLGLFYNAY